MNFDYSEEQSLFADSLGKLLSSNSGQDARKQLQAEDLEYDPKVWAQLAEMGLLSLPIPETYNGLGGTAVDTMVAAIEFGRHLAREPFTASTVLGAGAITLTGTDEQKSEHLPGLSDGSIQAAVALHEPGHRYDLMSAATQARHKGGAYRLTGHKSTVIGGPSADVFIVSANLAGGGSGPGTLGLFLVRAGADGVKQTPYRLADGRAAADLLLDNVHVPESDRLGAQHDIANLVEHISDLGTAALCAEALGALEKIIAMTADYLQVRTQFGKPIGEFQALQHQLAEMMIEFEHAKSLVFEAAMTADSTDGTARKRAVSAAKVYLGEGGRRICQNAIQMHGGIGMTEDYELGDYVKRAMVSELLFGDVDHHLERYARQDRPM